MKETDASLELVEKAAAGDRTAFEELYRETCRSVYFICLGFLKDEIEAQDVTQEVYLTVFEQLGTLEDISKFKPWLYRIAANKSINCLKKKQPILPGDDLLEGMETEDNENFLPEEYALNADKRELVLEITRKVCSDVLYQTILLYYFNEFSITEIAEIMECPEGTVKYRLSVARAKIKEGVLQYEKKSGDKLYSFAGVPFLTTLFTAQLQDMKMPSISLGFLGALPQSTLAVGAAKTGGSIMLKSLRLKIAAGIVAAVVVGGITAAVVIIQNQDTENFSEGDWGGAWSDIVDMGNTEDRDSSSEGDDLLWDAGTLLPGAENEEDTGTVLPAELPQLEKDQFFDTASEEDRARLIMSVKGNPRGEFRVYAIVTVTPPDPIWTVNEEFSRQNSDYTSLWFRDGNYGILQIFCSNQEESAEEGINEEIHWSVLDGSAYETGSVVNDAGEEFLWIKITYYLDGEVERYLLSFVKEYICGDDTTHTLTYRIYSGRDEEPFAENLLDYISSDALVIDVTPLVIKTE